MKKILFALLISNFCFGQQSITISPTDASHLKIFQKTGTAQLTVQGDGVDTDFLNPFGGTIGHAKIQLQSFVPSSSWGWKSYNSIDFNSAFSIKHTYTPNPSYSPDEFGIYEGTDSIFYYSGNSGKINSVAFSLSSSTSDMLQLHNKSTLANGVENRIFFRTGSNYSGAIKTIGKSETEARMGFFTNAIGNAGQLQERFSILNDGKIGINTTTPQYQMSFKDDLGDKISFYGGNLNNTTNHYGIGIQAAKFQLFTPSEVDDIVLGYGRSGAFTENVKFKGNGLVGMGVTNPSERLDVNGRVRIRHNVNSAGIWMSNSTNSTSIADGAFYGMKTNTEAGIWIGNNWRFWVNNIGDVTNIGEINRSQTSTANVVPIAYGNVSPGGVLYADASTDNISVLKTGTGVYEITITNETYGGFDFTTLTSLNSSNTFGFISSGSSGGKLRIFTANTTGSAVDYPFTFVVYKK